MPCDTTNTDIQRRSESDDPESAGRTNEPARVGAGVRGMAGDGVALAGRTGTAVAETEPDSATQPGERCVGN